MPQPQLPPDPVEIALERVGDEAFEAFADPTKAAELARAFAAGASWHLGKSLRFVADYELTQSDGGAADGADRATEHVVFGRVQTVF